MDQQTKSQPAKAVASDKPAATSDLAVDQFFTQLQSEMRRPDLSQEAIAAAFQAIQKLALDSGAEEAGQAAAANVSMAVSNACRACHAPNVPGSRFCSACGASLHPPGEGTGHASVSSSGPPQPAGEHYYHHHYHHHYFPAPNGGPQEAAPDFRSALATVAPRDPVRARMTSGTPNLSRAEAAVRRMTQNWAQACNTKQLDDLVEFYAADALVLRANVPPVRGTAAIREFFFAALDAGLGDAEFEPLRVELFGDVAFEAGRCKTLAPTPLGKRREDRGKYLIIFVKQPAGDWKAMVDCWSSDLNLGLSVDPGMKPGVQTPIAPLPRVPRKV